MHPDREFVGPDAVLSPAALSNPAEILSDLTVVGHDTRTLGRLSDDHVGVVFSTAVMERTHEIDQYLEEVRMAVWSHCFLEVRPGPPASGTTTAMRSPTARFLGTAIYPQLGRSPPRWAFPGRREPHR